MIYLISGKQNILLKSQMETIVNKSLSKIDAMNFVRFDGYLTTVQEMVREANYLPLGYEHKAIVIENPYYLFKSKGRNKIESEQDYPVLNDYLSHPNEVCDFIFLVNTSDAEINKKSELYGLIEKNGQIIELKEPEKREWVEIVKQFFIREWPEVIIDSDAASELARRTEGDYASLLNNGNKLALYTKHITFDDVALLVTRPLEENAFLLYNYLMEEKNADAVSLFRDLKSNNVEPVTLISMISNQFRLLNRVSYLSSRRYDSESIAKELGINPIRAKIFRRNSFVISRKTIAKTLEELFQLDLKIKSGLVDRHYSFELFLINFKRR
ncbi:MAG TPA: DNA polymerase III subunit delta [Erysipelotrichaceae bacterium]|nr:DNA polymerase III subunit delta [Erysipelotrichaceae bacterium]